MTWNEIYDRAYGAACGESTLKAKDEARYQMRNMMMDLGCHDPEDDEIPEETIEDYCEKFHIEFDDYGNITSIQLPDYIQELAYRCKYDDYLREDIQNELDNRKELPEVTDELIEQMMIKYRKIADCNIPYNVSIEMAVDLVLKG